MQISTRARAAFARLLLLFVAVVAIDCARTRVTRVRDPAYIGRSFASPAVFADITDLHTRQLIEEAMVSELERKGIRARAAIHLIPPTRDYTLEERLQILRGAGVDSLVVITAAWGTTRHYVPITRATTTTQGSMNLYGNYATYRERSNTQFHGGYEVEKPWAKGEFVILDLADGQEAWRGATETRGTGWDEIRKSACGEVAKWMVADRILAAESALPVAATNPLLTVEPPPSVADVPPPPPSPADVPDAAASPVDTGASDDPATRFDGCLVVADDGQPLGRITRDQNAPDSLMNKKGIHGSEGSTRSIFNRTGPYGSATSAASAFNPGASRPPVVFCRNAFAAYLTTNGSKTPSIDPRLLTSRLRSEQ